MHAKQAQLNELALRAFIAEKEKLASVTFSALSRYAPKNPGFKKANKDALRALNALKKRMRSVKKVKK